MRRFIPYLAVAVAAGIAGVTSFALGRNERRPTAVPPLQTPRLRTLWDKDSAARSAANPLPEDDTAVEEETPTLNVLTKGGLPEEPGRRDLEAGMEKIRQH